MNKTSKATMVKDATAQIIKSWNVPAHLGYTSEQFRYKHVLGELAGKEIFIAHTVVAGVQDCVAVHIPDGMKDHHNKPLESTVVAVPLVYLENTKPAHDVPVRFDEACSHPNATGAWWVKDGLDAVRMLTSWVDGFCSFQQREDR